jgi:uncharacterized protein YycO
MFIAYNPTLHKIKGHEVRKILNVLKKGDLMVRRWDGYLNTILTPGFWAHAGLYAGDNKAIHAVGEGVKEEDILTFCRADSLAVLRVKDGDPDKAVDTARKYLGHEYDYEFEGNDDQFYCSELCDVCYEHTFQDDYEDVAGNRVLAPGGIRKSDKVELVLEIKH